jgi:hypothetical protein
VIRGRYGLLIVVVVVAMLSVAAGAGLFMVYSPPLPDPSVATRRELFHWLVLRDLSKESAEIRQKILSRVDAEFENVDDITPTIEEMDEPRRQMLWHNVKVLLDPWLLGKAEQYSQLPASEKMGYIDRFLDRAEIWNKVGAACLKNSEGQGGSGASSVSKLIFEQIQQCSSRAAPEQREQVGTFMAAVEARWLWRQLPSFNF